MLSEFISPLIFITYATWKGKREKETTHSKWFPNTPIDHISRRANLAKGDQVNLSITVGTTTQEGKKRSKRKAHKGNNIPRLCYCCCCCCSSSSSSHIFRNPPIFRVWGIRPCIWNTVFSRKKKAGVPAMRPWRDRPWQPRGENKSVIAECRTHCAECGGVCGWCEASRLLLRHDLYVLGIG